MNDNVFNCINGTSKSAIAYKEALKDYVSDIEYSIKEIISSYPFLSDIKKYNIISEFYNHGDIKTLRKLRIHKIIIYKNHLFVDCGHNQICHFNELMIDLKIAICNAIKFNLRELAKTEKE